MTGNASFSDWGREAKEAFSGARDPARLATAVVKFHRTVDAVMDTTISGHGIALACKRGCGHCCSLRVEVQPAEAFTLAAWLRRNRTPDEIEVLLAKLRETVARTEAMGVETRKRTSIPCSLLGADGACSAYEARPAQCRRYHSLDVSVCIAFHDNPANDTIESEMHPALAHNAAVIITQAQQGVRAAGLETQNEDLNIALLEALENPKAWRRWKDGKKPFVR